MIRLSGNVAVRAADEPAPLAAAARKIFVAGPSMPRLIAEPADHEALRLKVVVRPDHAAVILASRLGDLTPELLALGRLNVVWSDDPRTERTPAPIVRNHLGLADVHIFNVYNDNVVTDIFYALDDHGPPQSAGAPELNAPFADKRMVAIFEREEPPADHSAEYSLLRQRNETVAIGAADGRIVLHGAGWPRLALPPPGPAEAILRRYNFAFCPEIVRWDHYVTASLWNALAANCLPIYAGPATLYPPFPRDSVVDISAFATPAELFDFVASMPLPEFRRRLDAAQGVFRRGLERGFGTASRRRTRARFAAFLDAYLAKPDKRPVPVPRPSPDALAAPPLARRRRTIAFIKDDMPKPLKGDRTALVKAGIEVVADPREADIIVGYRVRHFPLPLLRLNRLNILWSFGPYFSTETVPMVRVKHWQIHVFNVFNHNVYTDDFWELRRKDALPSRTKPNVPLANRRIVTLMTRKQHDLPIHGIQRSLTEVRAGIALDAHAKGGIDIYGLRWPEGVAIGESRNEDRVAAKGAVLAGYNFNLCIENCSWDCYTSEKIWDAIVAGCLPIYYANETLQHYAAVDAAILVNKYPDYDSIRAVIDGMPKSEFLDRLNTLIGFHNSALAERRGDEARTRSRRILMNFIEAMRD